MLTRVARYLAVVLACNLLLAGCDQKALFEKFVPKDDDVFARKFLDAVRTGDYNAADGMLDTSVRGTDSESKLHDLNSLMAHGQPVSVDIVGCNILNNTSTQPATQTTNLSYQVHFADAWLIGSIVVGHPGGAPSILGSRFEPVSQSLAVTNALTFSDKPFAHYVIFAIWLIVPLIILIAILVCVRSRVRLKWLWIIFMLFGFVQFTFDWSNGRLNVSPISFILGGISVFRLGPYAPWMLGFSIPVGAILFLILRRWLLVKDTAPETKPSDGTTSAG